MTMAVVIFSLTIVSISVFPKAISDIVLGSGRLRQYFVSSCICIAYVVALISTIILDSVWLQLMVALSVGATTFVAIVQCRNDQSKSAKAKT